MESTVAARVLAIQAALSKNADTPLPSRPDTRSPLDPWHDEGYLIRCLIRMHGWSWQEAGLLRRPKGGQ
jgi:hypothetical protein